MKIVSFLKYLLFFYVLLLLMIPLKNIYFQVEQVLEKNAVVISNEIIKSNIFSLTLDDSNVYFENNLVSKISHIELSSFVFLNTVNLEKIELTEELNEFFDYDFNELNIYHTILNPRSLQFNAEGTFGTAIGQIDFSEKRVLIELTPSPEMSEDSEDILSMMDENEGRYNYEYQF